MEYAQLVTLYEQLDATSKRLAKTHAVAQFLRGVHLDDIEHVAVLMLGRVFPLHDDRKIGVAAKLVIKAISLACATSTATIEKQWSKEGDLGTVATELLGKQRQQTLFSEKLTVAKVFTTLRNLASIEGAGSVDRKVKMIAELLTAGSPQDARYIVRTLLEQLRVGLGEGSVRDAIVLAFFEKESATHYDPEQAKLIVEDRAVYKEFTDVVQRAYDLTTDFAQVITLAKTKGRKGLEEVELAAGTPVKVMLFLKAKDIPDAFRIVGKPAVVEYKYDGFRLLVHKTGDDVKLFTRRLENVSVQFPDIVQAIRTHIKTHTCILDCEAAGYDAATKRYLPFQIVSQRIKRKHNIDEVAKKFPVEVIVFDVLLNEGKSCTELPLDERWKIVQQLVPKNENGTLRLAEHIETEDEAIAEDFYRKSLAAGVEGVMFKNAQSTYKPGSRTGFGVKVKPVLETLQLVIVGAEWGKGKRAQWLSSMVLACKDEHDQLFEIGKVSTGLKDKPEEGFSFPELTELLKPLITSEEGMQVRVQPQLIIEVDYEEIQKSTSYSSGYALRFPRFVGFRSDLGPEDANTIADVERLFDQQKGKSSQND